MTSRKPFTQHSPRILLNGQEFYEKIKSPPDRYADLICNYSRVEVFAALPKLTRPVFKSIVCMSLVQEFEERHYCCDVDDNEITFMTNPGHSNARCNVHITNISTLGAADCRLCSINSVNLD